MTFSVVFPPVNDCSADMVNETFDKNHWRSITHSFGPLWYLTLTLFFLIYNLQSVQDFDLYTLNVSIVSVLRKRILGTLQTPHRF